MDASRCISYFTIEVKGAIPEQFRTKIGANIFGCDICQDVCPWNGSYQPSAFSYQQTPSKRQQAPDRRDDTHPATTKVPQFHPMTVATIHPTKEEGSARQQLATGRGQRATVGGRRTRDDRRRATHDGRLTTDHGPRTTDAASFSLCAPPLDALASLGEEDFRRIFATSPIKRAKYGGWLRNLCVVMGNSGDERFAPWLERAALHSDPVVREHAVWALGRLRKK
jgi:epoxyqueuosine reductase